jgi:glycosyltransferase involved in cell wall biosynthesis
MSARPLVSVIVPTRDRAELVAEAVRSAVRQSHEQLEIVVVDDGSRPPLALPEDLTGDPRVTILRLERSVGAGAARNIGVRASNGPLLAFLDDDDTWRPDKVERQVGILAGCDETVAAVECGFDLWSGGRLVLRYLPSPDRDLARTLLEKPCLQPSTVLVRRSAFEQLGGFDPALLRVEDWDLWVRLADEYEAVPLGEVLVDRADSRSRDQLVWYREMVRRLEPRIARLPETERSRIRAVHLLSEAHLLAETGQRRQARQRAVRALREWPRGWPRPILYVLRTFIGESAWGVGKRLAWAVLRPVLRATGQRPF